MQARRKPQVGDRVEWVTYNTYKGKVIRLDPTKYPARVYIFWTYGDKTNNHLNGEGIHGLLPGGFYDPLVIRWLSSGEGEDMEDPLHALN